jgi:hypothetical protein
MATYAAPAWFKPSAFESTLVPEVRSFQSPYGGATQALDLLGERWRFMCELPACTRDDAAAREAFFHRLRGAANSVSLPHFARPVPRGTARGTLTLASSAAQGASSIAITGVRAGANVWTQSQAFDNAAWAKSNCTTAASGTTAPDGTSTAERLVEDTAVTVGRYVGQSMSWIAGTTYTISAFMREVTAGAKRYGGILVPSAVMGSNVGVQWDLATGLPVATAGTLVGSGAELFDNAWWRVWCSVTAVSSVSSAPQFRFDDAPPSIGGTWTGDGTSGIHIWGAQAEVATSPSPYAGLGSLLAGDLIGLGDQLHMVAEDATAANDGTMTVQLVNRLRAARTSGAAITWSRPTAKFVISGGVPAAYMPGRSVPGVQLEFTEVWS